MHALTACLQVLDALVCTGSAKVRVALLHSRVAAALLQEFSLEAGLLSLEQQVRCQVVGVVQGSCWVRG